MEYYCKRIIDTHVHIGGEKVGFIMTEEDVEYLIDKYKIAYAIVSNCDCVEVDCDQNLIPQNLQISQVDGFKRTLKLARKHPDKIGVAPFIKPLTFSQELSISPFCKYSTILSVDTFKSL
jgi:hypothetical protein